MFVNRPLCVISVVTIMGDDAWTMAYLVTMTWGDDHEGTY